jgi:hypothetical protein
MGPAAQTRNAATAKELGTGEKRSQPVEERLPQRIETRGLGVSDARQAAVVRRQEICQSLMAGAGGGTRTPKGFAARRIFVPLRLSPPPSGVCGLDYPFTLALAL